MPKAFKKRGTEAAPAGKPKANIAGLLRRRSRGLDKPKVIRDWAPQPEPVMVEYKEAPDGEQKEELTGAPGGWRGKRKVQRGGNGLRDRLHRAKIQAVSGFTSAGSLSGRIAKAVAGAVRGFTRKSNAQAWAGAAANNFAYRQAEPWIGDAAHVVGHQAANAAEHVVDYVERKHADYHSSIRALARDENKKAFEIPDLPMPDEEPPMPIYSRPEVAVQAYHNIQNSKPVKRVYIKSKRKFGPPEGHAPISGEQASALPGYKFSVQGKVKRRLSKLAAENDVGLKWSQRRRKAGKNGAFTRGLEMVGLGKQL